MRKFYYFMAVVAVVITSCQQEVVYHGRPSEEECDVLVENIKTRTYDEALVIAEDALKLLDGEDTRSAKKRVIKRDEGQVVMRPVTRGSETSEEPIMYVFNNEDNLGFTIVAADKANDPIIAVTEKGSYTYGEPTEVAAFDSYMSGVAERLMTPITPVFPDEPITPSTTIIADTIRHEITRVGPLLTTKWGQGGVYAIETRVDRAGCGPISMAQLMAFHRYPTTVELTYMTPHTMLTLNWDDIVRHTIGEGEHSGIFAWNYTCDCGCDYMSMAKFIREIGTRANINYSFTMNGLDITVTLDEVKSVLSQMGYHVREFAPFFDFETYVSEMLADLNASRPVLIMGQDANIEEGHIWVVDGYHYVDSEIDYYMKNPYYNPSLGGNQQEYEYAYTITEQYEVVHYNWGWNGMCDGWYNINFFAADEAFRYDDPNAYNSVDVNFKYDIELLYEIYPIN